MDGQAGVEPAVFQTAAAGDVVLLHLQPAPIAQPAVTLGTADDPGALAAQALVHRLVQAEGTVIEGFLLGQHRLQLDASLLHGLHPTFPPQRRFHLPQFLLGGQLAIAAHQLRANERGVERIVASVVIFPILPQTQRLHCVFQSGLLVGVEHHQVKGTLEVVDLQLQKFLHAIPAQVHIQHPDVAVAPGEKDRVAAAPMEELPRHRTESLRLLQGVHIQREHLAHPVVELLVDGGTDVAGEGLRLAVPLLQTAGADLDDLV